MSRTGSCSQENVLHLIERAKKTTHTHTFCSVQGSDVRALGGSILGRHVIYKNNSEGERERDTLGLFTSTVSLSNINPSRKKKKLQISGDKSRRETSSQKPTNFNSKKWTHTKNNQTSRLLLLCFSTSLRAAISSGFHLLAPYQTLHSFFKLKSRARRARCLRRRRRCIRCRPPGRASRSSRRWPGTHTRTYTHARKKKASERRSYCYKKKASECRSYCYIQRHLVWIELFSCVCCVKRGELKTKHTIHTTY